MQGPYQVCQALVLPMEKMKAVVNHLAQHLRVRGQERNVGIHLSLRIVLRKEIRTMLSTVLVQVQVQVHVVQAGHRILRLLQDVQQVMYVVLRPFLAQQALHLISHPSPKNNQIVRFITSKFLLEKKRSYLNRMYLEIHV